ncbi:MAG: dihydroorotase [Bacteroidia bacterium]
MVDKSTLIKNVFIVNEGKIFRGDLLIINGKIEEVGIAVSSFPENAEVIDATGKYLLPGIIDTHVHFREPGLTYKADIYTESKAAVAGGVTSFMDMPNTVPAVLTQELLEDKFRIAQDKSLANYSFYMGTSNNNLSEVLKTNPKNVCGVKIYLGTSTGNMCVDDPDTIEQLFAQCPTLLAAHCEDEQIIEENSKLFREKYGDNPPPASHPQIRNEECCYKSSLHAVELAKKHNTRLHVVHLSTVKETNLFENKTPLEKKQITAEVCIHHLWFSDKDYAGKGNWIKWNPAIKTENDRSGLMQALLDNKIDTIATDHAPHTPGEKEQHYFCCPSGAPMVQHSLVAMLEFYRSKRISLETIIQKMCHAPAICFHIEKRGFIRKGYFADLALVDLNSPWKVDKSNILYKCKWAPMEGETFHSRVTHTFVNGNMVYNSGTFNESIKGMRLAFNR